MPENKVFEQSPKEAQQKYYSISDIAKATGLSKSAITYYENNGLITPIRFDNGYRGYTEDQLQLIFLIQEYRELDFSIEDIKKLVDGMTLGDLREYLNAKREVYFQIIQKATLKIQRFNRIIHRLWDTQSVNVLENKTMPGIAWYKREQEFSSTVQKLLSVDPDAFFIQVEYLATGKTEFGMGIYKTELESVPYHLYQKLKTLKTAPALTKVVFADYKKKDFQDECKKLNQEALERNLKPQGIVIIQSILFTLDEQGHSRKSARLWLPLTK
ncbi:MAG: MerR family transcriptional regulator [Eubacteriales bacterium]|nr:MerR family transcriptional regulator [Eubacteriales bacterium]